MNHPAIIDRTQPTLPFLDWIARGGYRVDLTTEGPHIAATLIGTQQAWANRGEAGISSFVGYGSTREEALTKLAAACSGRKHHPEAKETFCWVCAGREEQFPTFTV